LEFGAKIRVPGKSKRLKGPEVEEGKGKKRQWPPEGEAQKRVFKALIPGRGLE